VSRTLAEETLDPRIFSVNALYRRRMQGDKESWPWPLNTTLSDPLFLHAETLKQHGITCRLERFYDFRDCADLGCRYLRACIGPMTDLLDATRALANLASSLETLVLREHLENRAMKLAREIGEECRRADAK